MKDIWQLRKPIDPLFATRARHGAGWIWSGLGKWYENQLQNMLPKFHGISRFSDLIDALWVYFHEISRNFTFAGFNKKTIQETNYQQKCIYMFSEFHEISWNFMKFHEISWNFSIAFQISISTYGIPSKSAKAHNIPWNSVKFHEIPWNSMKFREILWNFTEAS